MVLWCFSASPRAGGGTATPNCEADEREHSPTSDLLLNGCRDKGLEADLLNCGYHNKWNNYGLSFGQSNMADYCVRQRGYRYRSHPDWPPFCDMYPSKDGCAEAIRLYKKDNDEAVD